MGPCDALKHMQAGGGSSRGAVIWSGAEENQAPPHHLHRGAAGCTGGAVPAEPVPRCEHTREISTTHSLKRRKSRGKSGVPHSAFQSIAHEIRLTFFLNHEKFPNPWSVKCFYNVPSIMYASFSMLCLAVHT